MAKVVGSRVPANGTVSDKLVQGTMMLQRKLLGESTKEIAAEFRMSPATVNERLALARDAGVLQQAQLLILERLVPQALAVYQTAMTDELGDPELRLKAAKDVLFGTQALEQRSKATVVHEPSADTLEAFRAARKALPGEVTKVEDEDAPV